MRETHQPGPYKALLDPGGRVPCDHATMRHTPAYMVLFQRLPPRSRRTSPSGCCRPRAPSRSTRPKIATCRSASAAQQPIREPATHMCSETRSNSAIRRLASPSRRYCGATVTADTWPCQSSARPSALPRTARCTMVAATLW